MLYVQNTTFQLFTPAIVDSQISSHEAIIFMFEIKILYT